MDSPFGIIETSNEENEEINLDENIEDEEEDIMTEEPVEPKPKVKFSQTDIFKSRDTPLKKTENEEKLIEPKIKTIQGTPEPEEIKYELDDLKTMKNAELKQICKDKKIKNFSKLSKPDLCNLILGKPFKLKSKEIPIKVKKENKIKNVKTLKKESNTVSKIQVNNIVKKELEKYENERLLKKQEKKNKLLLEKKLKEEEQEEKMNKKIINKMPLDTRPKEIWEFF
jgi:hypothetical protein